MKKSEHYRKFYCIDNKGSLKFIDFLSFSKKSKKAVFINNAQLSDDISLKQKRISFHGMNFLLNRLTQKGYEITYVDGASERASKEEILDALDCNCNKEKLSLLCRVRPELYPYYSLKRIRITLRRFVRGELDDIYLTQWVILYIRCLLESYSENLVSKEERIFANVVASCLNELSVVSSNNLTTQEKYDLARKVYDEIKKVDEEFHKGIEIKHHLHKDK